VRVNFEALLRDFRPAEPSRKALRAILAECQGRAIPAALVLMPEGSTVRGWYSPAAHAGVAALLAELRGEFGVPLIDARTWLADDDFSDGLHLYAAGAERYSRRLAGEVLALRCGDTSPKR
jgi:lysophospholipase L1-like esterase